jgi:hypothetical protein
VPIAAEVGKKSQWTKWFRGWRAVLLLLIALAALLIEPHSGGAAVWALLRVEAYRHGWRWEAQEVRGSPFWKVTITRSRLLRKDRLEPSTAFEAERIVGRFAPWELLWRRRGSYISRVEIDQGHGHIEYRTGSSTPAPETELRSMPILWPREIVLRDCALAIGRDADRVSASGIDGVLSPMAKPLRIARVSIRSTGIARVFDNLTASASMRGARVFLNDMTLAEGARIERLVADFTKAATGEARVEMDAALFGGRFQGAIQHHRRATAPLEGSGLFHHISIEEAARFFGFAGDASGELKEGNVHYRGSVRAPEMATVSFRLDAGEVRLGHRKWRSLQMGATLVQRRLTIPEIELRQEKNELTARGEVQLPALGQPWWQSQFSMEIAARIEDLTEFCALIDPRFNTLAGRGNIEGSVSGSTSDFNGELRIKGEQLAYKGTPVEHLEATVNLRGPEIEIGDLAITNRGDFVKGRGRVTLTAQGRYAGEFKARISDLALYAPLLEEPWTPFSPAGGLEIDWSGDGSTQAHSGAFHAKFDQLRSLEGATPKVLPINAELEGTYSPESLWLNRFQLKEKNASFQSTLLLRPNSLHLQEIEMRSNGGGERLSGELTLPIDLGRAWRERSTQHLIIPDGALWIRLHAQDLAIERAFRLFGSAPPARGKLSGDIEWFGTPSAIAGKGTVEVRDGVLLNSDGKVRGKLEFRANASGPMVMIEELAFPVAGGEMIGLGTMMLNGALDPAYQLRLECRGLRWIPLPGAELKVEASLDVHHSPGTGTITGNAAVTAEPFRFASPDGNTNPPVLAPLPFPTAWRDFTVRIRTTAEKPLRLLPGGTAQPDVMISGTVASPEVVGRVEVAGMQIESSIGRAAVDSGTVYLGPAGTGWSLHVTGTAEGKPVTGYMLGSDVSAYEIFHTGNQWSWAEQPPVFRSSEKINRDSDTFGPVRFDLDAARPRTMNPLIFLSVAAL